jgi:predicted Holliday junction resolvase-like endonuclease
MIIEIIVIVGLLLVIGFQGYLIYILTEKWDIKEKDLLNRILARNYETYVQAEVLQKEKPLTEEDIYEQQRERGIPV